MAADRAIVIFLRECAAREQQKLREAAANRTAAPVADAMPKTAAEDDGKDEAPSATVPTPLRP